jgi:PTH1 family peptidyl-tRNA hydrolase
MADVRIVVGLGNPGKKYFDTRHNIGFKVIDLLAGTLKTNVKKKKFGACFGECEFSDNKLILLKPWQFMNNSGQAVATALGFYKVPLDKLLVITDDMAISPGKIRLRPKGSSGGHNGLEDVIEKLGTEEIARLRIGIGQSGGQEDIDFVLSRPTEQEWPLLNEAINKAQKAVFYWIEHGIEAAMNEFN